MNMVTIKLDQSLMSKLASIRPHAIESTLKKAETICKTKGYRFTATRQEVLSIIAQHSYAIKAYDILEIMSKKHGSTKPPTVYRALEFLIDAGFVHKIESLNAYSSCSQPHQHPHCHLLVCNQCGVVNEFFDHTIRDAAHIHAASEKFTPSYDAVEFLGACKKCSH
jgi:Fur family zinc uptake transcriptional regulator